MINFGTMVKPLHAGLAAQNGIVSAQLAANGFDGHPEAMEAQKGFFHAFGGGFDQERIAGQLGRPFHILDPGVSIKPYPCGVVGHPAMDGMLKLVTEEDVRPDQVEHVKVSTGSNILPPKGPLRYKKAQTALQGKFSVPFMMASMIIRRKAGTMEFTDQFVQSPAVQDMMDRIETFLDPEIDALGMDKIVTLIEMRLKDGRILRGKSPEDYRGGPRNPLSREELAEKFNDCAQLVLNPGRAKKVMETIEALENLDSVRTLARLATGPVSGR
jgi:2-methylcitrate dehydratase PrpD